MCASTIRITRKEGTGMIACLDIPNFFYIIRLKLSLESSDLLLYWYSIPKVPSKVSAGKFKASGVSSSSNILMLESILSSHEDWSLGQFGSVSGIIFHARQYNTMRIRQAPAENLLHTFPELSHIGVSDIDNISSIFNFMSLCILYTSSIYIYQSTCRSQ